MGNLVRVATLKFTPHKQLSQLRYYLIFKRIHHPQLSDQALDEKTLTFDDEGNRGEMVTANSHF